MHSGEDVLGTDLKLLLPPSVPQGAQLQGLISKLRLALLSADQSTSDNADKFLARRIKARLPSAGVKIPLKYSDAFRKEVAGCTDIAALLYTISEWASTSPDNIARQVLKSNPSRNIVVGSAMNTASKKIKNNNNNKQGEKKKSVTGSSSEIRKKTIEKKKKKKTTTTTTTRSTSTITSNTDTTTSTTQSSTSSKDAKSYRLTETAPRVRRELFKTTGKKGGRNIIIAHGTAVEEGDGARKQIMFSADISKSNKARPNTTATRQVVPVLDLIIPAGSSSVAHVSNTNTTIAMSPVTPAKGSSADPKLLIVAQELEEKERGNKKHKSDSAIFRGIRIKLAKHGYEVKNDSPEGKKIILATSTSRDIVSFLETIASVYKANPLELAECLLFDEVHSPRTLNNKIEKLGKEQQKKMQHESIFTRGKAQKVVDDYTEQVNNEMDMDEEMAFLNSDEGLLPEFLETRPNTTTEEVENNNNKKSEKKKKKKNKSSKKVVVADTPEPTGDETAEQPSSEETEQPPHNTTTTARDVVEDNDNSDTNEEEEEKISDDQNAPEEAVEEDPADEPEDYVEKEACADEVDDGVEEEEENEGGVDTEENNRNNNNNISRVKSGKDESEGDGGELSDVVEDISEELEQPPPSPVYQEGIIIRGVRKHAENNNNDDGETKAKRRKQRYQELARRVAQVETRQSYGVSWPTLFCFSSLVVYAVLFYYVFLLD